MAYRRPGTPSTEMQIHLGLHVSNTHVAGVMAMIHDPNMFFIILEHVEAESHS